MVLSHRLLACDTCHKATCFKGRRRTASPATRRTTTGRRIPITCGRVPDTCDTCHKASDPTWAGDLQPRELPAGRRPRHAALRALPQEQRLRRHAPRLLRLPQAHYDADENPNHAAAGFPTTCETCHKASDPTWNQAQLQSHTVFPLVGAHATQPCAACHKNNVYAGTPRDCFGCHKPNYDATTNPNHAAAGFPTTARPATRRPTSWNQGFNHTTVSRWSACTRRSLRACHRTASTRARRATASLPQAELRRRRRNPNHAARGIPDDLRDLPQGERPDWTRATSTTRSSSRWSASMPRSPAPPATRTASTRARRATASACHKADYDQTTNPNHAAAGFPTTCDTATRRPTRLEPGELQSRAVFALVGRPRDAACAACHKNGVYNGHADGLLRLPQGGLRRDDESQPRGGRLPDDVRHVSQGRRTRLERAQLQPRHVLRAGRRPRDEPLRRLPHERGLQGHADDCFGCHKHGLRPDLESEPHGGGLSDHVRHVPQVRPTANWNRRASTTRQFFALVGVHATQPCAACHKNNVYTGTPTTCVGCHLAQYNATTNPNHAAAGFPTTCDTCHKATDTTWARGCSTTPGSRSRPAGTQHPVRVLSHDAVELRGLLVHHGPVTRRPRPTAITPGPCRATFIRSNACYSCHPNGRAGNLPTRLRPRV